jgi:hypothetical protein
MQPPRGLSHYGHLRALATLDQTNAIRSPGWQAAFLGKAEPRAARPGMLPQRVRRVGPRIVPAGYKTIMSERSSA